MGVKDLWQLLSPIGRRVSIETLEGKVLAIDASIWITQFIKAMRDEEGKMMKNAHLIGTLRRILRLLYHRIRPLFVFDGATPELKLRVVQARRKGREKQEESKRSAAQRLLRAQLLQHAQSARHNQGNSSSDGNFVDTFKTKAIQSIVPSSQGKSDSTSSEVTGVEESPTDWLDGYENLVGKDTDNLHMENANSDEEEWQLPENTEEINADVLSSLPSHIRKSLIEDARRKLRNSSRANYLPVAGNPELYSQTQLANFLNSSKLNKKFVDAQHSLADASQGNTIAADGRKKYNIVRYTQDLPPVSTIVEVEDHSRVLVADSTQSSHSIQTSVVADTIPLGCTIVNNTAGIEVELEPEENDVAWLSCDEDDEEECNAVGVDDSGICIEGEDIEEENDDDHDPMQSIENSSNFPIKLASTSPTVDGFSGLNSSSGPVLSSEAAARAVLTASSMADWAGRTVRNALKEHLLSDKKFQPSSSSSTKNTIVPTEVEESLSYSNNVQINSTMIDDEMYQSFKLEDSTDNSYMINSSSHSNNGNSNSNDNGSDIKISSRSSNNNNNNNNDDDDDGNRNSYNSSIHNININNSIDEFHDEDSNTFKLLAQMERDRLDPSDARRQFNRAMRDSEGLSEELKLEVIELLQALSLPYIIAPFEAEAQCAILEQLGLVDGVVTEDSDALLFGAKTVYKNIFNDKKYVEVYLAEDANKEMGLQREDFVALAYFLGSDYTEGINGIGIVNAVEIIHAFPMKPSSPGALEAANLQCVPGSEGVGQKTSIEEEAPLPGLRKFKQWLDGYEFGVTSTTTMSSSASDLEKEFSERHRIGRSKWFVPESFPDPRVAKAYLKPAASYSRDSFTWQVPDAARARSFCEDKLGWSSEQISAAIDPILIRFAQKNIQTRIDAHYLTYHNDTRFAKISSTRLREAVVQITGKRSNLALSGKASSTGGHRKKSKP